MTTNKPGSVNQQPLYGCTSCYEDWTWPAGDLRVHDSECWCDPCWDERRWEFPDQPSWNDLEPYTPALQAECALLREQLDTMEEYKMAARHLVGIPASVGLWEPIEGFAARPQDILPAVINMALKIEALQAECEKLRKDAEFGRSVLSKRESALTKYQPCGCVICTCEHETQCQGCGAKHCGTHPVGQTPGPVYQQPAPGVAELVEALEAIQKASTIKGIHTGAKAGLVLGRIETICYIALQAYRRGGEV